MAGHGCSCSPQSSIRRAPTKQALGEHDAAARRCLRRALHRVPAEGDVSDCASGRTSTSAFALSLAMGYARQTRDMRVRSADRRHGEALVSATKRDARRGSRRRRLPVAGARWRRSDAPRACRRASSPAGSIASCRKLAAREPATLFAPATVTDRSDGKIAHLDGLNLSRAWCWRVDRRGAAAGRSAAPPCSGRGRASCRGHAARRGRLHGRALARDLRAAGAGGLTAS